MERNWACFSVLVRPQTNSFYTVYIYLTSVELHYLNIEVGLGTRRDETRRDETREGVQGN